MYIKIFLCHLFTSIYQIKNKPTGCIEQYHTSKKNINFTFFFKSMLKYKTHLICDHLIIIQEYKKVFFSFATRQITSFNSLRQETQNIHYKNVPLD